MTADDGAHLDSRQAIEGEDRSDIMRKSIATSLLWWTTASSLVLPILESDGDAAFSLIVGQRSVVELRSDGTLRRTGLRKFLRDGVGTLSIVRTNMKADALPEGYRELTTFRSWNGESVGKAGFKDNDPGARWRLLDGNVWYLTDGVERVGATVVIDTDAEFIGEARYDPPTSERFETFEQSRLLSHDAILVLPHTNRIAQFIAWYVEWVQAGRVTSPRRDLPEPPKWDLEAPPDPMRYTQLVPASADFQVTGLVKYGSFRDPSDLEAARALLQSRYDLKIGIWDLVDNPTLRRTLLEASPVESAPAKPAAVPDAAAKRANVKVAAKMSERAAHKQALDAIATHLKPLFELRWEPNPKGGGFRLPLTEPLSRWPEDEPVPLVELVLAIGKRHCSVSAFPYLYNQIDIAAYVTARREMLEQIAAPDPCPLGGNVRPVLWKVSGGWGDKVDWKRRAAALAERTPAWRDAFDSLCEESRRKRKQRFEQLARDA